jgi:integrase
MPVRRDPRTGRWRFRAVAQFPGGRRERIFGVPGIPGPFQDLPNTKAGATEAENRAKADALYGRASAPSSNQPRRVPTFNEYAEVFLASYLPGQKPRELGSKRQILRGHLLPAFGTLRLDELRQVDVDDFAAAELRRCAHKTVNNRLAVLSTLLGYAHENGLIPEPRIRCFITGGVKRKDAPIVAVEPADVDRLLARADELLAAAVLLATEAGLRVGEVRGLQWGDLKDGMLRVNRAADTEGRIGLPKHDKRRDVPVSPRLAAALARLPRRALWVVPAPSGSLLGYHAILERLNALYVAAGVEVPASEHGVTMPWHSLRHTFGTACAGRGVPLATLKELMGHEKIETTLRYVQVSTSEKRDAIALAFGRGTHVAPGPKADRQPGEK